MMIKKCLLAALLLGTAGAGVFAQSTVTLNEAIRNGADGISGALPRGTKIAVLNFSSVSYEAKSGYIIEEINDALVRKGTLTVVDRNNLELIRKEIGFNESGEVSDRSAQQAGRMLGAQVIVSGSLTETGGKYLFRIRALEVETAVIKYSVSFNVPKNKLLAAENSAANKDFTDGERAGAVALNLLFGIGSIAIQGDGLGFGLGIGIEVVGAIVMLVGIQPVKTEYRFYDQYGQYQTKEIKAKPDGTVFWIGFGIYAAGFAVSSIRALAYQPAASVAAADNPFPFEVALVPAHTQDGLGLRVSYTYSY